MNDVAQMRDPSLCWARLGGTTPGTFRDCPNPSMFPKSLCSEHGCRKCGSVILADTEDWPEPLCCDCFEAQRDLGRELEKQKAELGFARADNKRLVEANAAIGHQIERVIIERDKACGEADWLRDEEAKRDAENTALKAEMARLVLATDHA